MPSKPFTIFILFMVFLTGQFAAAQATNRALFEEMAVECLGTLPPEIDRFILEAPERMPYIRSVLAAAWQQDGREIFLPDAPSAGTVARVEYTVDEASVAYGKERRGVAREVRLSLRYAIANEEGRLLLDDQCARTRSDVITRGQIAAVENEAWPETKGESLPAGWFRRILEPAVLTAATAIAAWLFFTLRPTDGNDS